MRYRNIDHFLKCAYADEAHSIVASGSFHREDRGRKTGLTPQEKAQYYATARYALEQAFKEDEERLRCIQAKYGVGKTFMMAIASLSSQIMKVGQTDSQGEPLFELVKYSYDKKKSLRQLSAEFGVSMNSLLKDKKFIDGFIAGIEYRAMQVVERSLHEYIKEDVLAYRETA